MGSEEAPRTGRWSDVNLVWALRDLWRLRRLVGIVAIVALLAAGAVAFRVSFPGKIESRRYHVGVATTRILVDTPSSQVVAVSPRGSDTLGIRANLMASLMVDGVIKGLIAKHAGIAPNQLVGVAENADDGSHPADPPPGKAVNVLRTSVLQDNDGNQLPIIQIQTQAADAPHAARLANAAVEGLRTYLASQAAVEQVPDARRLSVDGLGAAPASEVARGPSLVVALGLAIFLFTVGCAVLLGVVRVIRSWDMAELEEATPLELDDELAAETMDDGADEVRSPVGHDTADEAGGRRRRSRERAISVSR